MKLEQRKIHLMILISSVFTALMLVIISSTYVQAATHCHSIGSGSYMIGDKNTLGNWCSYHQNGRLSQEIPYAHGKRHGTAREYFDNGERRAEYTYWNGKKNGQKFVWYRNGHLRSKHYYQDDKLDGEARTYYEQDGRPSTCWFYPHDGKRYKCPL